MPISVVVPAYNEEAGIRRLLEGLVNAPDAGTDIEIVVAPNGCTDRTAEVARTFGVEVVEVATASKTAALNAADAVATSYPRIYLDADIAATPGLIRELAEAVSRPGILGAAPRRVIDASASSWPVRCFYEINSRLPVFDGRLFGRGVIAIAAAARARFGAFPEITADDVLLDAIVARDEKVEIDQSVVVVAPRTLGDLIRRVGRARAGNQEFSSWAAQAPSGTQLPDAVPGPAPWSWLRHVAGRNPRLWPAAAWYVAIVTISAIRTRMPGWSARSGWGQRSATPVSTRDTPTQRQNV